MNQTTKEEWGLIASKIRKTIDQGEGVSVVIPAFNEETAIDDVVRRRVKMLQVAGGKYEVLVVDDCSRDRTGEIAEK